MKTHAAQGKELSDILSHPMATPTGGLTTLSTQQPSSLVLLHLMYKPSKILIASRCVYICTKANTVVCDIELNMSIKVTSVKINLLGCTK